MGTRGEGAANGAAYLDYNATAPMRPEAVAAMLRIMQSVGNSSSPHEYGRDAADAVSAGRLQLASLLGCSAGELVYTAGATEANNLALTTACAGARRVITAATEHPAVLEVARAVSLGSPVVLSVGADGRIDCAELRRTLSAGPAAVVSVMAANNETGVLADLEEIVAIAHDGGALVHTDATQMVGRLPIDLSVLDVDMLSLSAHKFGGPQGVGALFIRRGTRVPQVPIVRGGGQERGWRAGTLNVAGIVGAGAAASVAAASMGVECQRVEGLRDRLERSISASASTAFINGSRARRLPGVSSITFPGVPADALMASMPGIAVSDGSACSSGALGASHVLLAMGLSTDEAESTIRLSLGYGTTAAEIDNAIEAITNAVARLRDVMTPPVPSR